MQRAKDTSEDIPVSEMAIVDIFTKLIFGQGNDFTSSELSIIQAFRLVDASVLCDSHHEMGEYLRNLGVREMIQLVSRLHDYIRENVESLSSIQRGTAHPASVRQSG